MTGIPSVDIKRVREISLELNQLRIEQMIEMQSHNERLQELLRELERLTVQKS